MVNNLEIIKNVDFLKPLSDEAIKKVAQNFQEVNYSKGTVLFNEDDVGDCFYIVKKGRICLTKRLKIAENLTGELTFFTPYDSFGELALLDEEPRSATATAFEDTVLLRIDKKEFLNICKAYPEAMFSIVKTMSGRLRNTNDKVIDMLDELIKQSKLAAVGTAASKIVHDIKTPITVIVLTSQLIGKIFEGSSEFTEKIINQVNKLDEMVKEILDFARGDTLGLDIKEVDLKSFFDELKEDITPILEAHQVNMTMSSSVEQPVKFDKAKLNRVLMNLIKNAVEAIENKSGKIAINADIKDEYLQLSVQNNGPSISNNLIDKIFEPFITHKKKTGTGLGLAICRKIIIDHKGDITVSNLPKGGAKFDIYLPC